VFFFDAKIPPKIQPSTKYEGIFYQKFPVFIIISEIIIKENKALGGRSLSHCKTLFFFFLQL
jgi:hypothetical protein